jgi:V/A-type H+/Na+-transporting ATPase subunit K
MYVTQQALASLGGVIALIGGVIGSALGIGIAAPAGVAALADDPKQMRNVVVLAAMPFTQTFYGLVTLIIIFTSALPKVPADGMTGLVVLGIGTITGLAELFSAIWQGIICASGIALLPKTKGQIFTNTFLLALYDELPGTLGIVWAIVALSLLKLM